MPDHAGDVYETAGGAEEGEERGAGEEGAVVVALEGLLDDVEVCGEWGG